MGYSYTSDNLTQHAFVELVNTMQDLNSLVTLPAGWQLTSAVGINSSGQIVANGVNTSQNLTHAFRLTPVAAGHSLGGTVWTDADRDGVFGANESPAAGRIVFLDTNGNGTLDLSEKQTLSDAGGKYTFTGLANGAYKISVVLPADAHVTNGAGGGPDVAVTISGANKTGVNVGVTPPTQVNNTASIKGVTFKDANADGVQQAGEAGEGGKTIYLDADNDGLLDTGEAKTTTASDGSFAFTGLAAGTYHVRRVFSTGYAASTPAIDLTLTSGQAVAGVKIGSKSTAPPPPTGSLSGLAYNDTNANGVRDGGESVASGKTVFLDLDADGLLDANETRVTTAGDGTFMFTGLAAGAYHVRRVFPSGYSQSNPPINVMLAAGQALTGLTIGSKQGTTTPVDTASISGFAFNDANRDGVFNSGDVLAAGKTVWLDLDDDGVLDVGETSAVTDASGNFSFTDLAAGTYPVRRIFPAGYVESTPARQITLTSGQAVSGVSIGSKN